MVISVSGEYFVLETEKRPEREEVAAFFQNLGENDILEVRVKERAHAKGWYRYHVTKFFLENELGFMDLALPKKEDTFELAGRLCPSGAVMPVLDEEGNCVNIVKKIWTYYKHAYRYEGDLDLEFLNRYASVALVGLNEYSVELYRKALPLWTGKKVFLIGQEWRGYMDMLPELKHVSVILFDSTEHMRAMPEGRQEEEIAYVIERLPRNESLVRYERGILCYDEVMTLTFMFSHVIHPGKKNADKKFFLIDGYFEVEGIFGFWHKVFCAARYAMSKGYLPAFEIVSSDTNIYSDRAGDDIWNKFFLQPGDYTLEEVHESRYLALSPNMNILTTCRHVMDERSATAGELAWPRGIFNHRVQEYISKKREQFLPYPNRTLGVLLRGTDYVKNPLPNHPVHATWEKVVEKLSEVEKEWDFDWIYLATEDEQICRRMKERYKDRIFFTDQERYTVQPGQLLMEVHQKKEPGKGFRLGAEYLASVSLLAMCDSLLASGSCGALGEALRENEGKYKHVFVFESFA